MLKFSNKVYSETYCGRSHFGSRHRCRASPLSLGLCAHLCLGAFLRRAVLAQWRGGCGHSPLPACHSPLSSMLEAAEFDCLLFRFYWHFETLYHKLQSPCAMAIHSCHPPLIGLAEYNGLVVAGCVNSSARATNAERFVNILYRALAVCLDSSKPPHATQR